MSLQRFHLDLCATASVAVGQAGRDPTVHAEASYGAHSAGTQQRMKHAEQAASLLLLLHLKRSMNEKICLPNVGFAAWRLPTD